MQLILENFCIGAIEKQKLVYILNRDAQAHLTISSPLEAHKSNTLVYNIVGVDVGFENPVFACLEMDYEEADGDHTGEAAQKTQQTLTFYELDLGLNHVVRKYRFVVGLKLFFFTCINKCFIYSEPLEEHANFLITVPGGNDGPSGVLVCSENYITYKNLGEQHDIRCPIPRRRVSFAFFFVDRNWHWYLQPASDTRAGRLMPKSYLEMFASLDCEVHIPCRPGINLQYFRFKKYC